MIHEMKLNDKAFNNIKNGIKKFELRLYDDKRKNIRLGDTIIFHNLNNLDDTISEQEKKYGILAIKIQLL